jgi:hypothetical protein
MKNAAFSRSSLSSFVALLQRARYGQRFFEIFLIVRLEAVRQHKVGPRTPAIFHFLPRQTRRIILVRQIGRRELLHASVHSFVSILLRVFSNER